MGSGGEIPIPIPISSAYVVGGGGHDLHDPPPVLHPSSNGPPPPLSAAEGYHHAAANNNNSGGGSGVVYSSKKGGGVAAKYRECLKNHAAAIGGSATDGCGEFMPSGEEGTLEALKCSACGCHRNFHRKETDGRKAMAAAAAAAFACGTYNHPAAPHGMIMPLGAMRSSESDELEGGVLMARGGHGVHAHPPPAAPMAKKRFRTKFTAEQKEKMLSFAERLGWRLQRQEEGVVQRFCQEIGVKRRVLKVWMHNNKHHHSMAKKSLNAAAE